jgi:hypothetical protein
LILCSSKAKSRKPGVWHESVGLHKQACGAYYKSNAARLFQIFQYRLFRPESGLPSRYFPGFLSIMYQDACLN